MATTLMRTPKSAVRVVTELSLVTRLCFIVADFHVGFFLAGRFQCPPTRAFRCQNDRVCLQVSKRCDGVNNCGDNSDELNCRTCWRPRVFLNSALSSAAKERFNVRPQRPHRPFPRVRRTSSCALTTDASAPLCAATSSTTARTSAQMRLAARQVSNFTKKCSSVVCISKHSRAWLGFSFSDTKLNDCRSNRTQCGDGDEAHCVTNGTDSFCSCKPGFQKIGHRTCGGTRAHRSCRKQSGRCLGGRMRGD